MPASVNYPTPPVLEETVDLGRTRNTPSATILQFVSPPGEMGRTRFEDYRLAINLSDDPLRLCVSLQGEDCPFSLDKGGTALLRPGVTSRWMWRDLADCLVLSLPASFVDGVLPAPGAALSRYTPSGNISLNPVHDLVDCLQEGRPISSRYMPALLERFLYSLTTFETNPLSSNRGEPDAAFGTRSDIAASPSDPVANALMRIIESDHRGVVDLRAFADTHHLSQRQLQRRFSAAVGLSIRQFQIRVRADRALLGIRQTHDELKQVAMDCGFSDQAHMTRVIKDVTGRTPGDLRRQALAEG